MHTVATGHEQQQEQQGQDGTDADQRQLTDTDEPAEESCASTQQDGDVELEIGIHLLLWQLQHTLRLHDALGSEEDVQCLLYHLVDLGTPADESHLLGGKEGK